MTNATDAELVALTRGGDRDAYGELVARYQGHVYALAYSLADNWAEAQDIAQDTFIRAYMNLEGLREPNRFPRLAATSHLQRGDEVVEKLQAGIVPAARRPG